MAIFAWAVLFITEVWRNSRVFIQCPEFVQVLFKMASSDLGPALVPIIDIRAI